VAGPHYLAVAAAEGDGRKNKNKQNDAKFSIYHLSSPNSSTQAGSQSHLRIWLPGYFVAKAKVI
jgi:hypothetical protein